MYIKVTRTFGILALGSIHNIIMFIAKEVGSNSQEGASISKDSMSVHTETCDLPKKFIAQ